MDDRLPRPRRPRPVSEAPFSALLDGAATLAKGWLLAVLEQADLHEAHGIPAPGFAADGPRLCVALVRALADDAALAELRKGGALEALAGGAGEMLGAREVDGTLRAVDALSAVVWSAVLTAWPAAERDSVAALAERLAAVIAVVRAAALRRVESGAAVVSSASGERRSEALWQQALAAEIATAQRAQTPVALLLVELDDVERLRASASEADAAEAFERFTAAIGSIVRRQDILAREDVGRSWLIARDTDRRGAEALGRRAIEALRAAGPWRGAPLTASAGIAVLGEDAVDADGLIAAAEEACLAASASGAGLISPDDAAPG